MSAEENKAILLHAMEHFNNKNDRSGYFALYDDDCILHRGPGVNRGIESIKQFYSEAWTAFPDGIQTLDDVIAEGDKVEARYTFHGTHLGIFMDIPPTGRQVTVTGIATLRFANGKCVERWYPANMADFLRQLGVDAR